MRKLMLFAALLSLTSLGWAESQQESTERLNNAATVLHEIMSTPDKGIPEEVLDHAKCIAVVPHMIKGGFVFGAENGRGVATCRTARGWSAPAFFAITGGSWGLQIGVEGVDLVMIIQNDKGMQRLLSSKFRAWRRCIGSSRTRGTSCFSRHRLEARYRDTDLLSRQRRLCRTHVVGGFDPSRRGFHAGLLRASCHDPGCPDGKSGGASRCALVPGRSQGGESSGSRG